MLTAFTNVLIFRYDVAKMPADRLLQTIERDYMHLIKEKRIFESPNYLREKGKPVLAIYGMSQPSSRQATG